MLLKLVKHDMRTMSKSMLPLLGIMILGILILGVLGGVTLKNYTHESVVQFSICAIMPIMSLVLICAFSLCVLIFVHYYKSFMTDIGYLEFTLPVTGTAHLLSKSISAVIWLLMILLSTLFFTAGAVFIIFLIAQPTALDSIGTVVAQIKLALSAQLDAVFGSANSLYLGSVLLFNMFSTLRSLFQAYYAITLGGFSNGHKLLKGLCAYFLINLIIYFAGDILSIIFKDIPKQLEYMPAAALHLLLAGILFIMTKHLLNKKINLQ